MLRGLKKVPTPDLEALLRAIYNKRVEFPLRRQHLLVMGMNRLADEGDVLLGLDERGVRAVVIAVIAERTETASNTPGL